MSAIPKVDADIVNEQYLTFRIAGERFGLALSKTREVIEYGKVTTVPLMPDFLCGVINLRGEVVPIIDLAIRLGRKPIEIQRRTCIVIIEVISEEQKITLGLLADAVDEVTEFSSQDIEDAPSFGARIRAEFIFGIAKSDGDFVVLLDAEKTLSVSELSALVEAEFE
ncbi:MAG TPA: chemotaxis protein CheW [Marinagarivorans sp.]